MARIKAASEQSITAYVREFVSSVHVDVGDMVIPGYSLQLRRSLRHRY